MNQYKNCHPGEQWFCRIFDRRWTQSGCPYYFKLNHDKKGNPRNLQCYFKEDDGGTSYVGTYRILKMEEIDGENYLVMQRIGNETFENIKPVSEDLLLDEIGDIIAARYYPTGWYRLELMPPIDSIAERLLKDYPGEPTSKILTE